MHVAVDREDAPRGVGRQHVGIGDQIAAPTPEIGAVGRQLDHARVVGMHQRIVPQHHEDVAARIDGDVGDKARVQRPGAEGPLDAIEPVSEFNDQFMDGQGFPSGLPAKGCVVAQCRAMSSRRVTHTP